MAFHVRNPKAETMVRELARQRGVGLTDAIILAVDAELKRTTEAVPLYERLKPIQDEIASWGRTGLVADKAFFDDLWGEGDD